MMRPSFYPYCDRRHVITVHDTGKPCVQCAEEDAGPSGVSGTVAEHVDLSELGGPRLLTKSFEGHEFLVVDPASIGFRGHTTHCFDDHEPTLALLSMLKPGDVFVDIGAQFGAYALPALAMGAVVVAFEPTEYGSETLKASAKANGWEDRCEVRREALYDGSPYPVELKTEVFGQHYPSSGHPETTLDDVFGNEWHPVFDEASETGTRWMKLDVEGAELGVLRGAQKTLVAFRPHLIIEDHDGIDPGRGCQVSDYPALIDSSKKIHAMLEDLGYAIEVVPFDVSRKYIVATPRPQAAAPPEV